jgi:acetyl esterase/lipase
MDQAALDAGYNNSLAVTNCNELLLDFEQRSAAIRRMHDSFLELRYVPAPRNRIDYFAADKPGPLVIFIHGGYWQMRAKENFSFVATGPLAHGIHVALVGYTLAPELPMAGIVEAVRLSIAWLKNHAANYGDDVDNMILSLILSCWSAGRDLTAMCLDEPDIIGGIAISDIYDLEPIQLS